MRALWIEMYQRWKSFPVLRSRPVRALWIEILNTIRIVTNGKVEAREGLVD